MLVVVFSLMGTVDATPIPGTPTLNGDTTPVGDLYNVQYNNPANLNLTAANA